VFEWFWKRIFSDKNLEYLIEKSEPYMDKFIEKRAKTAVFNLLEDEEVGEWVTAYGDALYKRYIGKLAGSIGGAQRGINFQQKGSPLDALGDMENFDLMSLFKLFASGGFKRGTTTTSPSSGW